MQAEAANHRKVLRSRAGVLSVAEKAHEMRQVCIEKANESEPPLKCRNVVGGIKTESNSVSWDEIWKQPVYCPGGARHEGGASSIQALAWNGRTCRVDEKGEAQVAETTRVRVPMRPTGADRLVVAMKPL